MLMIFNWPLVGRDPEETTSLQPKQGVATNNGVCKKGLTRMLKKKFGIMEPNFEYLYTIKYE